MELPDKLANILCAHVKVRYDIDGIDMTIGFEAGYRMCFKELEPLIEALVSFRDGTSDDIDYSYEHIQEEMKKIGI